MVPEQLQRQKTRTLTHPSHQVQKLTESEPHHRPNRRYNTTGFLGKKVIGRNVHDLGKANISITQQTPKAEFTEKKN